MSNDDRGRDSFREFVNALAEKPNSQLMTEEKVERIRRVVKGGDDIDTARFRFYVRSKGFSIIDLPLLGLQFANGPSSHLIRSDTDQVEIPTGIPTWSVLGCMTSSLVCLTVCKCPSFYVQLQAAISEFVRHACSLQS